MQLTDEELDNPFENGFAMRPIRAPDGRIFTLKHKIKLFVDDIRPQPDSSWIVVRTAQQFIDFIENNGVPRLISFDHDLGMDYSVYNCDWNECEPWNGNHLARLLVSKAYYGQWTLPDDFVYYVHSSNPIGGLQIINTLEDYLQHGQLPQESVLSNSSM